jgi:hypothetical protein
MRDGQLRSATGSLFIQAAFYAFFLLTPSHFSTSWKPAEFLLAVGAAAVGLYTKSQGPHQRMTVIGFEVFAVGLGAVALATRGIYLTGTIVGIILLIQLLTAGAKTVPPAVPLVNNPAPVPHAQQWLVQPPGATPTPGLPPSYGQPTYGQPTYGQPTYGQPTYGQPVYGQPTDQAPYQRPAPAQVNPGAPVPIPAPDFGFFGPPVVPAAVPVQGAEPTKPAEASGWQATPPS